MARQTSDKAPAERGSPGSHPDEDRSQLFRRMVFNVVCGIIALKNHLARDCKFRPIDLGRGDQLTPEYLALNPT